MNLSAISLMTYDEMVSILNAKFDFRNLGTEHVFVMAFTSNQDLIGIVEAGSGTYKNFLLPIREMFIALLLLGCEQFVFFHNHVNGPLEASAEDWSITADIQRAAKLLNVRYLNHIIVNKQGYIAMN